jgi:hypothetical protein
MALARAAEQRLTGWQPRPKPKRLMAALGALTVAGALLGGCALAPVDSTTGEPPDARVTLAPGLVFQVVKPHESALAVFDPGKGGPIQVVTLPATASGQLRREQFSADWTSLVWAPCDLRLAHLSSRGFAQVASWRVPTALGGDKSCFSNPSFSPDGRVYALVRPIRPTPIRPTPTPPTPSPASPATRPTTPTQPTGTIVSVDPDDPSVAVRPGGHAAVFDSAGRPAQSVPVTEPGTYSRSSVMLSGSELVAASLAAASDPPTFATGGGYSYSCQQRLNAATLLCALSAGRPAYGLLATATVDRRTATVTMSPFVQGRAPVLEYAVSPERKKVMAHLKSGWWMAPMVAGSAPTLLYPRLWRTEGLAFAPRLVGWA